MLPAVCCARAQVPSFLLELGMVGGNFACALCVPPIAYPYIDNRVVVPVVPHKAVAEVSR